MRRAAFKPAAPPRMTTWVSLFARILIGNSHSSEFGDLLIWRFGDVHFARSRNRPITNSFLLQRHVHNVGERGVAVVHVDIKALLTEGPHRIKPLFFPRPTATDPDFYAVQLPLRLGFAKAGNDPTKRFLHIREVGNGATDDN